MNKEDVLIWLTQLGKDWVGLTDAYETYTLDSQEDVIDFWDKLTDWHDGAYITKRYNTYNYEQFQRHGFNTPHTDGIEQYKLTRKAIHSLEE